MTVTRDWTTPNAAMHDMENLGGATLRRACADLSLPMSGQKFQLADRLLDAGLSARDVHSRYGWRKS